MALTSEVESCYLLGFVTYVASMSLRRHFSIGSVVAQTAYPIKLGQITVNNGPRGEPTGYATWAYLSDTVQSQILTNPDRLLHLQEWNEGVHLWIMDIAVTNGGLRPLLRQLAERAVQGHKHVHFHRRSTDGTIRRTVTLNLRDCYSPPLSQRIAAPQHARLREVGDIWTA